MIRSFQGKRAQAIFARQAVRGFSCDLQRAAYRKLAILDAAGAVADLRIPPGNRLEKLTGDRAGQYSIRINDQWRICFRWSQGDAFDVEVVDYH
jgi:proteic killer suppression protein